ncbi:MAG TPA: haloacid dehalogenase type II, partial [Rhodospirillaceae bacterium]|nr:haloacid dehalogenase type II [Rhodospirillaceae bacterium]
MSRDTVLFDINETVLDLSSLKPGFEAVFQDAGVIATWFAMLLQTSTVCVLTGVETGFARLAAIT